MFLSGTFLIMLFSYNNIKIYNKLLVKSENIFKVYTGLSINEIKDILLAHETNKENLN